MLAFRWKRILVACVALLGGATDVRAEAWLNFYPVSGEVSLSAEGRWTQVDPGSDSQQTEFYERLNLNLGGYSLDPKIFSFNIRLDPALRQTTTDMGSSTNRVDTTYLNYAADFRLFHGVAAWPLSLRGNFSNRNTKTDGSLGSWSDTTTETRGGDLLWKFTPFPSTLSYREQSQEEIYYAGFGQPPRERSYFQKTASYRGESRGMKLYLEHIDYDDRTAVDEDYLSQRARLENTFRWGKNSSLSSQVEYLDREGFDAEERVSVDESLRLQHTRNLFTTYSYGYESQNRTVDTETHRGSFGLNHRLYQNLDTRFGLYGSTTQSDQFAQDTYGGNLDFNYNKSFGSGLNVTANLGGGYSATDRTGGQIDFSESLSVPATGIVVLTQQYVVWTTILVRAPGCDPCLEGPDYLVQDAGGNFTQLVIPAGSLINIGDTITVDYAYYPPTVEFRSIPYRVGIRLEYGGFGIFHRTNGENQTYVSGPDQSAVTDSRTDTTGVDWTWSGSGAVIAVGAERIYSESDIRTTTEYRLRQSLSYRLAPRASLNASLSESYFRDTVDVDSYNGDVSIRWFPAPGLSVSPRLSAFRRIMDPGAEEDFLKAGVDVDWSWRRLSGKLIYDHILRSYGETETVEDRLFVSLSRKF